MRQRRGPSNHSAGFQNLAGIMVQENTRIWNGKYSRKVKTNTRYGDSVPMIPRCSLMRCAG